MPAQVKTIVLIPDGMTDEPIGTLGGRTPLEAACTPNMDGIARAGLTGWVQTVPDGMKPSSDVACMSILGYDPARYHPGGRAPLEAASLGLRLQPGEVAFRCNLVTVADGKLTDYSAGHITSAEAKQLIETLDQALGGEDGRFHAGVSYRHLWLTRGHAGAQCTPPHDIQGQAIDSYFPSGDGAAELGRLMRESVRVLADHPVNRARVAKGESPANMVWLWGQGTAPQLPSFRERFGKSAGIITAVDLLRGIGRLTGLEVIDVPGATGYFDTDYEGKAKAALEALKRHDLVFLHVEATDEAGHIGNVEKKIEAIEAVDMLVLGTLLDGLERRADRRAWPWRLRWRLLMLPDHITSCAKQTHVAGPVPFVIAGPGIRPNGATGYNERAVPASGVRIDEGHRLLDYLFTTGAN